MNTSKYTINKSNNPFPKTTVIDHINSPSKSSLAIHSGIDTQVSGDPLIWVEFKNDVKTDGGQQDELLPAVDSKERNSLPISGDDAMTSPSVKIQSRSSNLSNDSLSTNSKKSLELPKVVRAVSGTWLGRTSKPIQQDNIHKLKTPTRKAYESQKDVIDRIFKTDEFKRVSYDMLLDNYKVHSKRPTAIKRSSTNLLSSCNY